MTKARDLANASTALSAVSATELAFVDGVTSAIQTQMDAKTAKATLTTTGDIYYASGANTPARLGIGSSAQVLTVASGVPSWATPSGGGKVLQVVTATTSTAVSFSSGTMTDSGLTVTITPTLATSKVLILVSQPLGVSSSAAFGTAMQLLRGATVVYKIGDSFETLSTNFGSGRLDAVIPMAYLDSPATTSATTYKTQGRGNNGTPTVTFQNNSITASIVAMEIGA